MLAAHRAAGGMVIAAVHGALDLAGAATLDVGAHAAAPEAWGDPFAEALG